MNNALLTAWRIPCVRISSAHHSPVPASSLLRLFSSEAQSGQSPRPGRLNICDAFQKRLNAKAIPSAPQHTRLRPAHPPSRSFRTSPTHLKRSKTPRPRESAKPDTPRTLSAKEIQEVLGAPDIPASVGNRALRVLQSRRIEGTLDLDLPKDVTESVPQFACDNGLEWLREFYPMDEDAAIMRRIEREEKEEEEKLIRRAESLGIYKPQSGRFGAEKEKESDVYGKSVLQEVRKKNEKLNEQKDEEDRVKWLEGEAEDKKKITEDLGKSTNLKKYDESAVVKAQPRVDPKERPALAWIQKHHLRATSTDFGEADKLTKAQRILPSLGVAILVAGLCCFYAKVYEPPSHEQRRWPEVPRSAATAAGLIGLNFAIFALWRIPPAWRMLNRYFISAPVYPYAMSMVGSVFSHQQLRHLGVNMAILWFIGTKIHDEIGRGDFLALYTATGVLASACSLTAHVLGNNLAVTSLGASGAIAGLMAAWCMLRSDDKFTLIFLPEAYQETFSSTGRNFLVAVVAVEIISLVTPLRVVAGLDHWAHLGGYAAGALVGWYWKKKKERQKKEKGVWERYFGS